MLKKYAVPTFFTTVVISFSFIATSNTTKYESALVELDLAQNPDNPDLEYMHHEYTENKLDKIAFRQRTNNSFDINIISENVRNQSIVLKDINLLEFIPTIPKYLNNDYLRHIAIINQEWNRNQVSFDIDNEIKLGSQSISRVDIARNCLNSYLWELQLFNQQSDIIYHGWFEFPKPLYQSLFEKRNNKPFEFFENYLESWTPLESKIVDLTALRQSVFEQEIEFSDGSSKMYPMSGERKRKQKEIVFPHNYSSMTDFQSDSTRFASFSPPGIYNRSIPRETELSRFKKLTKIIRRETKTLLENKVRTELEFLFVGKKGLATNLIIGGLDPSEFPVLIEDRANDGMMYPMGIGNHLFYESYTEQQCRSSLTSPYYGLVTDDKHKWLDSHEIGIDGPLIHKDKHGNLHVWLLSFERHALIGHYVLKS